MCYTNMILWKGELIKIVIFFCVILRCSCLNISYSLLFTASIFVESRSKDHQQKDPVHSLPLWLFLHTIHLVDCCYQIVVLRPGMHQLKTFAKTIVQHLNDTCAILEQHLGNMHNNRTLVQQWYYS